MSLSDDTVAQIAANVRRLAEENPDQIAECSYEYCIVGRAAAEVDIDLVEWEGENIDNLIAEGVFPDSSASDWLSVVQAYQDIGRTWSRSVELADDLAWQRGWDRPICDAPLDASCPS